jgi:hypothetical protein
MTSSIDRLVLVPRVCSRECPSHGPLAFGGHRCAMFLAKVLARGKRHSGSRLQIDFRSLTVRTCPLCLCPCTAGVGSRRDSIRIIEQVWQPLRVCAFCASDGLTDCPSMSASPAGSLALSQGRVYIGPRRADWNEKVFDLSTVTVDGKPVRTHTPPHAHPHTRPLRPHCTASIVG